MAPQGQLARTVAPVVKCDPRAICPTAVLMVLSPN